MKPQSFAELFKRAEEHEDYWLAGAILEFTEAVVREMERCLDRCQGSVPGQPVQVSGDVRPLRMP